MFTQPLHVRGLFKESIYLFIYCAEVDYNQLDSPVRLGKVWGYIGKMRFFTGKCVS